MLPFIITGEKLFINERNSEMKTKLFFLCFIICMLFCGGCGNVAEEKMSSYIERKYGEKTTFEYIKAYNDNAKGYYGKTTDGYYVRYTDFGFGEEDNICDTKQYDEIEQVICEQIRVYAKDAGITEEIEFEFFIGSEENEGGLWRSLWNGYGEDAYYDGGDVTEFMKNAYPYMYNAYVGDNYDQTGIIMIYSEEMYEHELLSQFILKVVDELAIRIKLCVVSPEAKGVFDNSGDYWETDNSCIVMQACELYSSNMFNDAENIKWEKDQEVYRLNEMFSFAARRVNPTELNKDNWMVDVVPQEEKMDCIKYHEVEYEVVQDGVLLTSKEPEAKYICFSLNISEALEKYAAEDLMIFVARKNGEVSKVISLDSDMEYDVHAEVSNEFAFYNNMLCSYLGEDENEFYIWVAIKK